MHTADTAPTATARRPPRSRTTSPHDELGARCRSPQVVGRPRPRPDRPDPGRPRHLRREHRAADHRRVAAPGQQRPAVAGHRLPAAVRRRSAARRPHRRPAPATPGVPDRHDHLHRRLPGQRLREQRHRAHRRPRHPGPRCRPHDPSRAVARHDHVLRRAAHHAASPCGARSAASVSPPASCSAARSRPGSAGSSSSGSTCPSASSPSPSGSRSSRRTSPPAPACAQFDLPGALTVIGGLGALMYGLGRHLRARLAVGPSPGRVRRLRASCSPRSSASRRGPPARWSRRTPGRSRTLVSGTTVMLGATALLVGAVFLTSHLLPDRHGLLRAARRSRVPAAGPRHHRRHPRSPASCWPRRRRATSPPAASPSSPSAPPCCR